MHTHVLSSEKAQAAFSCPTALWQRIADCHLAVGQQFSGHVWTGHVSKCSAGKGSQGQRRLGNAAPAPPGVSITVPLNRFPIAPPGDALLSPF